MKQVRVSQFGQPQDVLEVVEAALPEPGPGQIRVKVTARPINPSDALNIQGVYGKPPALPAVIGFEGVGVIDACGPGVPLPTGLRVYALTAGTWSEYIVLPAMATIPIPDEINDETACQLIVNPFSAWLMMDELGLKPGDWVLQTAGGSALGQMFVQLARKRGIKTISTVRRDDQVALLLSKGADVVVNTEKESLLERVREVTQGKGVPGAIDAIGGKPGAQALACLSTGGTMLAYGVMSGEEIPVYSGMMLFKGLTLKGFWLTRWVMTASAQARQALLENILGMMATGELTLPVEARYPLEQVREAVAHATRPGRNGKILLVSPS